MTQRERVPDNNQERAVVYNTTPQPVQGHVQATPDVTPVATFEQPDGHAAVYGQPTIDTRETQALYNAPDVNVENIVETPVDRVRWGAVIAGLLCALSALAVLSLLGLALGASAVDPGDQARGFGIGAGIWGGLSALLAFLLGGWVAARTAAVRGERNGMINGAMVWALAVPLLLYLLGSGVGSLIGTAANTGAQAAGAIADQAANGGVNTPAVQATAQAGVDNLQNLVTPNNIANAAESTARAAWGTLGSLLLALGAAALGGYFGARMPTMPWNRRRPVTNI